MISKQHKQQGFTLLEILIALFIFVIITGIVGAALYSVLSARTDTRKRANELSQEQTAIAIINNDFSQMVNRPVVVSSGARQPGLSGQANQIIFTHGGYSNPFMRLKRSTLQRVAYSVQNNQLVRSSWPVLDRVSEDANPNRVLMDKVKNIAFFYEGPDLRKYTVWPPSDAQAKLLPVAVIINIYLEKHGFIQRIILV